MICYYLLKTSKININTLIHRRKVPNIHFKELVKLKLSNKHVLPYHAKGDYSILYLEDTVPLQFAIDDAECAMCNGEIHGQINKTKYGS